jgi:excisionase family DNA binding protein
MITMEDIAARLDRLERATALSKNVLTVDEVAMLTGYSVKYLRLLISNRDIPHYRRGNRLYFNRAEVEEWMQETRIPTNEEMRIKAMNY